MILGIGCDIVQVSRFNKGRTFLIRFIKRCCTLNEINELRAKLESPEDKELVLAVATRFAAKEAVSKALGSGFRYGITLQDIEITHNFLGRPEVTLYNKALTEAFTISQNTTFKMHLTLSNEREYVNAVAVIESI